MFINPDEPKRNPQSQDFADASRGNPALVHKLSNSVCLSKPFLEVLLAGMIMAKAIVEAPKIVERDSCLPVITDVAASLMKAPEKIATLLPRMFVLEADQIAA